MNTKTSSSKAIPSLNISQKILLMDGGLGQELENKKLPEHEKYWSAASLIHDPKATVEVHLKHINAGSKLIIANTYMNSRRGLTASGIGEKFEELNILACQLAAEAVKQSNQPVFIAGSLPPLLKSYRPDLTGEFEDNLREYREMSHIMAPYVDLFICETMTGYEEALAASTAAAETGLPVWVSWTLKEDGSNRSLTEENIPKLVSISEKVPVDAYLFNCCSPESITKAIPELRKHTNRPIGGYANAFNKIPDNWDLSQGLPGSRKDITPDKYAEFVSDWINNGATIIGGCCEICTEHIAALNTLIQKKG